MGAGASTKAEILESSIKLGEAVKTLTSLPWDRVHVRLHSGKINKPAKAPKPPQAENITSVLSDSASKAGDLISDKLIGLDYQVIFEVVPGASLPGEDNAPVAHPLLDESELPTTFKSRIVKGSSTPHFHDADLMLFLRSPAFNPTVNDTCNRKVLVKLVDADTGLLDGDEKTLAQWTTDIPSTKDGFKRVTLESKDGIYSVTFDLMFTLFENPIVKKADMDAFYSRMQATLLGPFKDGVSHAVVRAVTKDGNKNAVLWLPGRNDSFHNPTFANMLLDNDCDVYVLDYRRGGACRKYFPGTFNPLLVSHCSDFSEYTEEIDAALGIIEGKGYKKIFSYSHSTGCPITLTYVMNKGSACRFDGYIFNSPFLEWGFVGGDGIEMVLKYVIPNVSQLKILGPEHAMSKGGSLQDLSTWHFKVWSLFPFDTDTQAIYKTTFSAGFCLAFDNFSTQLRSRNEHNPITTKPFLVFSTPHDRCLNGDEVDSYSRLIGPERSSISIQWAHHDVLCSDTHEKNEENINYVKNYLTSTLLK